MAENSHHAGRPRNHLLDDALLAAARATFLERGYHSASLAEIGRRAGVGTPAIYRRWPTKAELAIDLVVRESLPQPLPDTGSIRRDLTTFMRLRLRMWSSPLFRQVMLPVAYDALAQPELHERIRRAFVDYRNPWLEPRVKQAIAAGQLRRDTNPARLLNLLMGTITMPMLFSQDLPRESQAESIVDQLLEGFLPRPAARRRQKR